MLDPTGFWRCGLGVDVTHETCNNEVMGILLETRGALQWLESRAEQGDGLLICLLGGSSQLGSN